MTILTVSWGNFNDLNKDENNGTFNSKCLLTDYNNHIPDGLGVRIPGFHPGGPGSIPGLGALFENKKSI